jgi:hypothetical protein
VARAFARDGPERDPSLLDASQECLYRRSRAWVIGGDEAPLTPFGGGAVLGELARRIELIAALDAAIETAPSVGGVGLAKQGVRGVRPVRRWRRSRSRCCAAGTRCSIWSACALRGGVHSGSKLSATHSHSTALAMLYRAGSQRTEPLWSGWRLGAGDRAVAGSNPVSPARESATRAAHTEGGVGNARTDSHGAARLLVP